MDLKQELCNSVKGLKKQSEIALKSDGNNKEINRAELKEAHSMISPDILKSNIIKDYMKVKGIDSLIEIDEEELSEWIAKEFNFDYSEVANLVSVNDDEKIHLGSSLQKIKEESNKLEYIETSNFTLCDKKVKGYGASHLVVCVDTPETMESFFKEVKEDFNNVCEDCMNKAFGSEYWKISTRKG
jgi:hypothetical protein